jgi:hypothetical protein
VVDAPLPPRAEYDRRIARWRLTMAAGQRTHLLVSNLRLAVGGAVVVLAWQAFVPARLSPAWLIAPALAFLVLIVAHARVILRNERAARAERVYLRGVDRLEGRWAGSGPDGGRFLEGHPYARDLDLFGQGSLFQLMDIARTEAGQDTLAAWLSAPATRDEIIARQAAVQELAPRLDFREDVAILAAEAHVGRTSALSAWAAARPAGLSATSAGVLGGSAAVTALLVGATLAGLPAGGWAFGWILIQTGLAAIWRRQVALVLHRIDMPAYDLALVVGLLERIEREPFESPRLAAIHGRLVTGGVLPSRRIARLRTFISALDSTHNLLFRPIAALLLVRSLAAVAIDRWHAAHGAELDDWLRAVGELEALSSLATHAYEHPADPYPDIVERGPLFDAEALAHPLLVETVAVRNDVRLGGGGPQVLVVSGSNMSGKSTLLRAVGVNVVLALAGAPVRAAKLRLSALALGATLRIEDSLQAGHSRFYAEILRIRGIVDVARGRVPVLFLLDEILHGTNSYDRRLGAQAIVRALVDAGAIGLVTTHDLALTELVSTMGAQAANVHFEDRIDDGKIVFDYRMRPGVVERSNALALMRAVGLEV